MSVFTDYEREVIRLLLGRRWPTSAIDALLEEAVLVSIEHTGCGYFLTASHPSVASERIVYDEPAVQGSLTGVHCGFVLFLENGELCLECFGFPTETNLSGDVPRDVREQPVRIEQVV